MRWTGSRAMAKGAAEKVWLLNAFQFRPSASEETKNGWFLFDEAV
jgi:hypothetical protein